ncbi:MAG: C2H2-type zinc finger protein [Lachnospiraceae bacterium]|nr:C2H2-type zinc finger protein [Lachnospiraceae bacterium]
MNDDKKREELKAKINEKLDQLSVEELEKFAGGKIIVEGETYTCKYCGDTFWNVDMLMNHMNNAHRVIQG